MCDAHEGVVHGDAKVVDGQAVAAQDDKVSQGVGVELHLAPDSVRYDDVLVRRHPEAVAEWRSLQHAQPNLSSHFTL